MGLLSWFRRRSVAEKILKLEKDFAEIRMYEKGKFIFEYLKPKVNELERKYFYLSEIGATKEELLPLKYTIQGYKICLGELEDYFLKQENKKGDR